jgi:hypothetical protein
LGLILDLAYSRLRLIVGSIPLENIIATGDHGLCTRACSQGRVVAVFRTVSVAWENPYCTGIDI